MHQSLVTFERVKSPSGLQQMLTCCKSSSAVKEGATAVMTYFGGPTRMHGGLMHGVTCGRRGVSAGFDSDWACYLHVQFAGMIILKIMRSLIQRS